MCTPVVVGVIVRLKFPFTSVVTLPKGLPSCNTASFNPAILGSSCPVTGYVAPALMEVGSGKSIFGTTEIVFSAVLP